MMIGTQLRVIMPASELEKIDQEAGKHLRSRSDVILRIVREYFSRKHRNPLFPKIGFDLRLLPPAHREKLLQRQRIVMAWHRARIAGQGRGQTMGKVLDAFLMRLRMQGIEVSRRTLYGWFLRYSAKGLPGLMDGRMRDDL